MSSNSPVDIIMICCADDDDGRWQCKLLSVPMTKINVLTILFVSKSLLSVVYHCENIIFKVFVMVFSNLFYKSLARSPG